MPGAKDFHGVHFRLLINLMDLLMGETTEPQEYDTIKWHEQLQDYIDKH